jgi:hypothetical protein
MNSDIWTDSLIRELSDDDIKNFHDIVLRDVKNKYSTDEDKSILQNNLDLWLYCLRITRKEIELQLSQHRTNLKSNVKELYENSAEDSEIQDLKLEEERWRNNAMKFLNAVERKTLYVKLILNDEETN